MRKTKIFSTSRLTGAVSLSALYLGSLTAFAQQAQTVSVSIEPQPLQKALVKYSEQYRTVIVAPAEMVAGKQSSAVGGELSATDALAVMLKGTGLVAQRDANGAMTLKAGRFPEVDNSRGPFPVAAITTVDQAAPPPPAPPVQKAAIDDDKRDTVVVTGLRGEPRSVIDSPTPVDVFTAEDLAQGSSTGIFESLRFLVPSFNLPTRAGGGTATVIATGGLRGLNPDQTLVLVNGKRRHKTALINSVSSLYNGAAGVDLNMIPASAIQRIEVLRDGAAAQYGSDAIAGVINIILKDDASGGDASVSYGQNFDRSDGKYTTASAGQGAALGDSGFAHLSYSYMDRDSSNRAVPIDPSVRLYNPTGTPDPRETSIDRMVTKNYGSMPQTSHIFAANVGYNLNDTTEFYSFGTYGARESVLNWSYRTPYNIASLPELYPNGFRPTLTIKEDDFEVAAGVKGDFGGWKWDLSTNYGKDITDWENTNGLNPSLGPTSPVFFEVGRLLSSEWVNSLDVTKPFELPGMGELQVSFGLQHRLENYTVEKGDPASYAAGTYVRPAGQYFAGQAQAPGAQATPGFRPEDEANADRTNLNGYAELGWTPFEKLFIDAAVRYEYFDDDAGDTTIYKVNGRYELFDWLAFRASYNTGFRAPTLAQQYYSSTTSQFRDLDGDGVSELVLLKNLPANSAAAIALGSSPLVPETSRNISGGFTFNPPGTNFTLTVDAYQIEVDDRIAITSTFSPLDTRASATPGVTVGKQIQNILVANGLSPEVSGQYYTNAIDTRTKGIDVVATYRLNTDSIGDFDFNAGFNMNETDITGIIANPPQLAALGPIVIFDRGKQGSITDSIPDSKLTLSAKWDLGKFGVDVRGTRFGEYTNRNATNPASDYTVDPEWIADLELSYSVTDVFKIYVGADNVFNTYPQQINPPGATDGSGMYNTLAPFGFTGGNWYLRGTYKW